MGPRSEIVIQVYSKGIGIYIERQRYIKIGIVKGVQVKVYRKRYRYFEIGKGIWKEVYVKVYRNRYR